MVVLGIILALLGFLLVGNWLGWIGVVLIVVGLCLGFGHVGGPVRGRWY